MGPMYARRILQTSKAIFLAICLLIMSAGLQAAEAQPGQSGLPAVARAVFGNCIYCDIVGDFYARAESGASTVSASVSGMLKPFASALFSMWLSWRLLGTIVPFLGRGTSGLGEIVGISFLFVVAMSALNTWGGSSSLKGMIYEPVLAAAVGGSESISNGVAGSLNLTPLSSGAPSGACSGNRGKQAACATWAAGSYAAVGITLGYAMIVGKIDGGNISFMGYSIPGLGVMWDRVTQAIFGTIMMVVWGVSMLLLPVIAMVFVMKVTLLYAFSPIFVLAAPFPSARARATKALGSLVAALLQLWGVALVAGIVGAAMQGILASSGGGWALVDTVYNDAKALTVLDANYLKLLVGGVLSTMAMLKVAALIQQFADDAMGAAGVNGGMVGALAGGAIGAAGATAGGVLAGGRMLHNGGSTIQSYRRSAAAEAHGAQAMIARFAARDPKASEEQRRAFALKAQDHSLKQAALQNANRRAGDRRGMVSSTSNVASSAIRAGGGSGRGVSRGLSQL